jgi:SAM-dependent methyltransferase
MLWKKLMNKLTNTGNNGLNIGIPLPKETELYCPVCGSHEGFDPIPISYLVQFQQYEFVHNLFDIETLNMANYTCRKCGCTDRERLYALFFETEMIAAATRVLDFAPGAAFITWAKNKFLQGYQTADLYKDEVDIRLDIAAMTDVPGRSLDYLICSHILEHVPKDKVAMQEISRVLKPGGKALVMVPIIRSLQHTTENVENTDPAFRWKHFGQEDHVRWYGKSDFIKRLQQAGLKVEELGAAFFGASRMEKYGIMPSAVLYIAKASAQ